MRPGVPQDDVAQIVRGFRAWVENQRLAGVDDFPEQNRTLGLPPAHSGKVSLAVQLPPGLRPSPPGKVASPGEADGDGGAVDEGTSLEAVREDLGDCVRCKLCEGRTQIVFGVGSPNAGVLFVGEGPGEEEDRRGEPFVGRAGRLLTDIIQKGMGLSRADVYIANVVKCRPPNNRNPEPDEIAACQPFLVKQLEAIEPRVVVALGKFAAQTLLQTRTPISKLRGHWHDFRGIKLMPTFHPSYLLRNPSDKRLVWEDIQLVMKELGLRPPERKNRRPPR